MRGTPFLTTDHTREWSARNTSPSVDPGAGNPVSKQGQLQCACSLYYQSEVTVKWTSFNKSILRCYSNNLCSKNKLSEIK